MVLAPLGAMCAAAVGHKSALPPTGSTLTLRAHHYRPRSGFEFRAVNSRSREPAQHQTSLSVSALRVPLGAAHAEQLATIRQGIPERVDKRLDL